MKTIASYIDHTILAPDATSNQIINLCNEARRYHFHAVCVNSHFVPLVRKELAASDVKIACVIGFPLGASSTEAKVCEAVSACREGAHELDMVINIGALKEGADDAVLADIRAVVDAAKSFGSTVKVILETGLLDDEQVVRACNLAERAGAAFVKTSTGFSSGGATLHHVQLMKESVGSGVQVKASGGIRDLATAKAMIAAGADRIGTSSGVAIVQEEAFDE